MTRIVKNAEGGSVRTFRPGEASPAPAATPPNPEIVALKVEAEALARSLSQAKEDGARAREDARTAFAEGRDAGLQEADDGARERLALLRAGLARAQERHAAQIEALERLAVEIAREALSKMLGDRDLHADLLARAVRARMAAIEADTVLKIEVSSEDFPNADDLDALSIAIGGVEVKASGKTGSGECRIETTLGGFEVGIGRQWSRLQPVLDALAAPEPSK
ncbi:MAG TPA: hypothetical protein VD929_06640 [Caulobacteraceae bacterium]|nr:hypothetical protein [Caulobacteraceae bacterium]